MGKPESNHDASLPGTSAGTPESGTPHTDTGTPVLVPGSDTHCSVEPAVTPVRQKYKHPRKKDPPTIPVGNSKYPALNVFGITRIPCGGGYRIVKK